jgi:ribosome maturation factor RimP
MMSLEKITQILQPILDKYNAKLVDISLVGPKNRPFLRILADREGGITIGECANINKELGDILDKDDSIKESYVLEVSSPGIDRPFKRKEGAE